MARTISQIKFIETTSFDYQIEFIYDGSALRTKNIERQDETAKVVSIINALLDDWDLKRAKTNYDALKVAFEGKTVNI